MEKDEKEGSPPESEDVPENDITFLQKLKSFLGIQHDMTVQITSKMMMEGAVKARKRGINLNLAPVIILDFVGQEVFYSTHMTYLSMYNQTCIKRSSLRQIIAGLIKQYKKK